METVNVGASIIPIKCALRYKPPVLILVYKDEATGVWCTRFVGVLELP